MLIYLIQQESTDYYKIGLTRSKTATKRIKQLQTASPTKLLLISEYETKHGYKLETALHNYFKPNKINNEWFKDINRTQFLDFCKCTEDNMDYIQEHSTLVY